MYTTTTDGYKKMLNRMWETKTPLFVYGGYGIGKSQIPVQHFKEVAAKENKIFIRWEESTNDEKMNMIKNAGDYFVFTDQRVGTMDPCDLRGIPNMMNSEMLQTIPYAWVIYFTQKDASGVIFFDELNLAPQTVAGAAYQIINDRTVSDRKIADNVLLIAAGNRAQDKAHVFQMPAPLKDRFAEVEIGPDLKSWSEWAAGKINPHFVAFLQWKPNLLYVPDEKGSDKASTPRGVERASKLVGDMEITSNDAMEMVSISLGESWATQFQAYCKHYSQLNWKTIYKKPETVSTFELDKLWAVAGGIGDQFSKKITNERFDEMMGVVLEMRADFAMVTLQLIKAFDRKKFIDYIKKSSHFKTITKAYSKYIME